jgi:glutamine amidotransferase
VVATRYVSSRNDAAASLVCVLSPFLNQGTQSTSQWFSSGTAFSEDAEGGHYKMSKADKRENIILVSPHPSR